jgi:hypothetical protein
MNPNDLNDFKKAMNTITAAIEANEKYLVGPLAVRLNKASEENPGDQTIYSLASFLRSKSEKEMFISKAELNKVYDKLYTFGSNCSNYLENELIKKDVVEAKKMARDDENFDLYKSADSHLVNALTSVFDKTAIYKPYSNEIAGLAVKSCAKELSYFPVVPSKIEVVAGNEDVLLCKASYETPKGQSHVLIPVEISEGKALFPSVFVSTAGFDDLNKKNLGDHLNKSAGKHFQVNVDTILNVIKTAKHGISTDESLSEVERIVVKAELNKKAENYNHESMFFELNEKTAGDVKLVADKDDVESFAQRLGSTKGIAEVTFGKKAVDAGKVMIRQAMESFGHKNVQVAVSDVSTDTVFYSASSGSSGIKVPVKFANELPVPPSIALANGVVESFDAAGIDKLLNEGDIKEAALTSVFYGSKPNELIETIKVAMSEQNFGKAEEALNVLANSGDNKAYQFGFSTYMAGLNSKPVEKTASEIQKCAMQVKSPNSIHILCGHTNLPLNKVYQDANGDCLPLYHKNSEETTGGSFLDSRLYIG